MTARGGTTRPARVVVCALLVAVLAAAFAMLSWINRDAAAEEAARVDALAAGPALVEDVLSYTPPGRSTRTWQEPRRPPPASFTISSSNMRRKLLYRSRKNPE
ncbi:hypothetical protein GCM10023094_16350 [Rhodococcus olei]|uniref:Uncharacterized protein n=1 Tax=Rhodococcus olei TaxID=2161675 RepID=A0ABP8NWS3_9NOCA